MGSYLLPENFLDISDDYQIYFRYNLYVPESQKCEGQELINVTKLALEFQPWILGTLLKWLQQDLTNCDP